MMVERDSRRQFSRAERMAAWLAQDGKSVISGQPLGPDFHADHRSPWTSGGKTSIENCDAITPQENLGKGAKMRDRFKWQDEFVQAWTAHLEPNFFLCALPGAGKTRASSRVIRLWLERGGIIVIVTPTLPIQRNWRKQLQKLKIYVDENFYGYVRENYRGIVTTYQALNGQSLAFRKLCADQSVLLICDEIHHASENENSSWGTDLRAAFNLAKRRLLLSGTPVRSDKENTSFLQIEEFKEDDGSTGHRYKMDFLYDWPRALEDNVVRSITFHRMAMNEVHVEYVEKGNVTFLNDDDAWLTYALEDRKFLLSILRAAAEKLEQIRQDDPTAAGLAVAKNIPHAKILSEILSMLGQSPTIVHSQHENDSLDAIESFDVDNSKKWIVAVQQISEGVDIPRLRVEAYLTNYATELAFRQLVGRCVRRREMETDEQAQAHVFLPDTPRLTKLADKIEKLQALAFKKYGIFDGPEKGERGYTIGGSEPQFVGYIIHGTHYVGDRASVIQQLMGKYKVSEQSAVLILEDADGLKTGESPDDVSTSALEMPPWDEEKLLKDDCNELVKDLIKIRRQRRGYGEVYDETVYRKLVKEIQTEFMIDGRRQPEMSVNQLKRKKDKLREAILREQGF